jgi:hypothetical protein
MQHVKAEALAGIGGIEPFLEPRVPGQGGLSRKRANATQDLVLVRRFGSDPSKVGDEILY